MKTKWIFMLVLLLSFSIYGRALAVEKERQIEDEEYTVKKGDTLWDISSSFLKDPFQWPKLWKVNPYIINPDLIYPGNKIRLIPLEPVKTGEKGKEAGVEAALSVPEDLPVEKLQKPEEEKQEVAAKEAVVETQQPPLPLAIFEEKPASQVVKLASFMMEKHGLISVKEREGVGIILGSQEEQLLQSQGDIVYVSFAKGIEVKQSDKFTIFTVAGEIKHPVTDKSVGFLTDTLGILEVVKVEPGGVISAWIEKSYKEIVKGAKLKRYEPPVREVVLKKAEKVIDGFIVASLEGKVGVAENDIVYLDKGESSGLEQGNTMSIFRPTRTVSDPLSKEDKTITFPSAELGKLIIIHTEENTSAAFIIESRQVIYKGDRVRTAE